VDNGSTDGTLEYFKEIPDATIIENDQNLGWERALNQGIQASNAPYILFLNNDTEVTKNWLTSMLKYFGKSYTGAVGPKSNYVMGKQSLNYKPLVDEAKHLVGFCFLVLRDVLEKVKEKDYIDESGCSDDHDLSIRIRQAGYKLRVANDVFVYHHFSKTLTEVVPDYIKYSLERRRLLRLKWGIEVVAELFTDGTKGRLSPDIIFTTDDVWPSNLGFFEYWYYVKDKYPNLKLIAFVTANYAYKEDVSKNDLFQQWFEETKDWVEVGVHGYDHGNPPEQERDDAEELVVKSLEILKPYLPEKFLYRPPGFQRTIHTEPMLKKLGFAGIAHQTRIKYFNEGIVEGIFNTHCTNKHANSITKWRNWF